MGSRNGGAAPEIVTFLIVELGDVATRLVRGPVAQMLLDGGGLEAAAPENRDGRYLAAAEFPMAVDAAVTALDIALRCSTSDPPPRLRAIVHTVQRGEHGTSHHPEIARAMALLAEARDGEILATASTAAIVSPSLPSGIDLVDRTDLVLHPSRRVERLYELRSVDAAVPPARPQMPVTRSNLGWARRAAASPLVGRTEPAARLDAAWEATLRGSRRMVVLVGEGGVGKTAVAAELALRAHALGALVLYGRCDREQASPYEAVREALGTYAIGCPPAQLTKDLKDYQRDIRRVLADTRCAQPSDRRDPSSVASGDPRRERLRFHEAVHAWLDRLAAHRPVLLVLDDLHWVDHPSRQLVDYLQRATGRAPWMLLATTRPDATETAGRPAGFRPDTGVGHEGVEHIELGGLTSSAVSELVQRMTGCVLEPDDEAVEWLTAETAGNPLLVQKLLRGIRHAGDLRAELLAARNELPEHLTDFVRWRLSHLPLPTRHLLGQAASIGSSVNLDQLAGAALSPPVIVRDTLEPAVRDELLRIHADGEQYDFTHEVIRRALTNGSDVSPDAVRRPSVWASQSASERRAARHS
jgi:hypothetical protein